MKDFRKTTNQQKRITTSRIRRTRKAEVNCRIKNKIWQEFKQEVYSSTKNRTKKF